LLWFRITEKRSGAGDARDGNNGVAKGVAEKGNPGGGGTSRKKKTAKNEREGVLVGRRTCGPLALRKGGLLEPRKTTTNGGDWQQFAHPMLHKEEKRKKDGRNPGREHVESWGAQWEWFCRRIKRVAGRVRQAQWQKLGINMY